MTISVGAGVAAGGCVITGVAVNFVVSVTGSVLVIDTAVG